MSINPILTHAVLIDEIQWGLSIKLIEFSQGDRERGESRNWEPLVL